MDVAEYRKLARELIPALLEAELAAPWLEVEARIADASYGECRYFIEPHHLSQARSYLEDRGLITQRRETTRGGRTVSLWTLSGVKRGQKAVDRASARKRLVTARYLGWAQGTPSRPGITGTAAEIVAHASTVEAARHGFTLASPDGPGVSTFLGHQVPVGPLDCAAIRMELTDGIPSGFTAIPIEVKNLRDWIYPSSQELYQLLDKAAQLQQLHPEVDMAPVLICRRAHITTMRMAKGLGFFVVPTRRQYIAPTADEDRVTEVRHELGFLDLVRQDGPDQKITDSLVHHLPKVLERTIEHWKRSAEELGGYFSVLRQEDNIVERSALVIEMKENARRAWALDFNLGW